MLQIDIMIVPMSEQQFNTYVNEKYSNPDGIHHYEISQESGDTTQKIEVYDPDLISSDTDAYTSATAITNREFEESEQDKKRKIRLLDPVFIDQFVDEFKISNERVNHLMTVGLQYAGDFDIEMRHY